MDEAEARAWLLARSDALEQEGQINAEAHNPVTLQQKSVGRLSGMDAMQMQAMALAAHRRREGDLRRIAAALARLDKGEWGYCQSCGEEMAEAQLRHDAAAAQCVTCASRT